MALPVKLRTIYKKLRSVESERQKALTVIVTGEKESGKSALIKAFGKARLNVFSETEDIPKVARDLLVLAIPADEKLSVQSKELIKKAANEDCVIVLTKIDKAKNIDDILASLEKMNVDFSNVCPVSAKNNTGIEDLMKRMASLLGIKKLALAYQVPSFSKIVVDSITKASAKQNAVVGAVFIIPGADMPVMTANEIKMILEIASVYGVEMDLQRAKEILAVIGGGYGLREIARQLLDFIPGPGWVIKGSVAYGGTFALAKAADLYFQKVVSSTYPDKINP